MSFEINHTVEIEAPAETVWQVIVGLDDYPNWNPFVVSCRSTLEVGSPIVMRVRLFDAFAQKQRETIFEHTPGKRLSYGLALMPLGALASARSHEVFALTASRTRYESRFELRGWLAPVVSGLLGSRLRRGFASMTEALARRASQA